MQINTKMLNFFMSFLATNLLFIVLFMLLIIFAAILEIRHVKGKLFTTKKITYLAAFVALSAILNIITGYFSNLFWGSRFKIELGQIIIMIPGMLFGPLSGIVCGLCADTLGSMAEGFKSYHLGFTFEISLIGFIGGMVWLFANRKNWIIFTIGFYMFSLALFEFVLTPVCLITLGIFPSYTFVYSWAFMGFVLLSFCIKFIIYLLFFFLLFQISYQICAKSFDNLWCNKKVKEIYFFIPKKLQKNIKTSLND